MWLSRLLAAPDRVSVRRCPSLRAKTASTYQRCIRILESLLNQLVDGVWWGSVWLSFCIMERAAFRWLSEMENV